MATPLPYLAIALDSVIADVRLTMGAMGQGFEGLIRPLVALSDENATPQTPAVAWAQFDASANSDLVAQLQALCGGDLPPIMGVWGEEGIIQAGDAQMAFSENKVTIISAVGIEDDDRVNWAIGNFALLGYKFRPEDI